MSTQGKCTRNCANIRKIQLKVSFNYNNQDYVNIGKIHRELCQHRDYRLGIMSSQEKYIGSYVNIGNLRWNGDQIVWGPIDVEPKRYRLWNGVVIRRYGIYMDIDTYGMDMEGN